MFKQTVYLRNIQVRKNFTLTSIARENSTHRSALSEVIHAKRNTPRLVKILEDSFGLPILKIRELNVSGRVITSAIRDRVALKKSDKRRKYRV